MTAEDFVALLENVKPVGAGRWMARCPAHEDKTASMSVRWAEDRILIHDFGGCDNVAILNAMGLRFRDVMPEQPWGERQPRIDPSRVRVPAGDILRWLATESWVVGMIAGKFVSKREIDESEWHRLAIAVRRITDARALINPQPPRRKKP